MKPGEIVASPKSSIRACSGIAEPLPTALIWLPSITTRPGVTISRPSNIRADFKTIGCAARQSADSAPRKSTRISASLHQRVESRTDFGKLEFITSGQRGLGKHALACEYDFRHLTQHQLQRQPRYGEDCWPVHCRGKRVCEIAICHRIRRCDVNGSSDAAICERELNESHDVINMYPRQPLLSVPESPADAPTNRAGHFGISAAIAPENGAEPQINHAGNECFRRPRFALPLQAHVREKAQPGPRILGQSFVAARSVDPDRRGTEQRSRLRIGFLD